MIAILGILCIQHKSDAEINVIKLGDKVYNAQYFSHFTVDSNYFLAHANLPIDLAKNFRDGHQCLDSTVPRFRLTRVLRPYAPCYSCYLCYRTAFTRCHIFQIVRGGSLRFHPHPRLVGGAGAAVLCDFKIEFADLDRQ